MTDRLTLEEVVAKTRELLGDGVDLSYITQELVDGDYAEPESRVIEAATKGVTAARCFGNNTRYGARIVGGVTYHGYWFDSGTNQSWPGLNHACGSGYRHFVTIDFHHTMLGICTNNGREKWRFDG